MHRILTIPNGNRAAVSDAIKMALLSGFYQQGYSKSDQGSWYLEQRPSVNMNTSTNISLFKISNQIRYEYRINTDWHDYRIKNTLVISCPEVFLRPSVGWELYYEHHDRDITLNRIKFGITKDINAHFPWGLIIALIFQKIIIIGILQDSL